MRIVEELVEIWLNEVCDTALPTTALIKRYMIAPKKGTPTLSSFLLNNCHSPVCTTHNRVQHGVYTKKDITNRPNYKVRT